MAEQKSVATSKKVAEEYFQGELDDLDRAFGRVGISTPAVPGPEAARLIESRSSGLSCNRFGARKVAVISVFNKENIAPGQPSLFASNTVRNPKRKIKAVEAEQPAPDTSRLSSS